MLFNSYEFIFLFMPVLLLGYALLGKRGRLVFLTVMSYLFYGWWDYRFCALMLASTLIDYWAGGGISRASSSAVRRAWLIFSLVSNLSLLGFFKYFDLLARTVNEVAGWFHTTPAAVLPLLHIVLPVGISFYTFQSMSYTIDVYRGNVKAAPTLWNFACFVSLFPQLVAGPIIRYRDLAEQLVERAHTSDKTALGVTFFVVGLAKKVIIADAAAPIVAQVFGMAAPGFAAAWSGVLAYAVQIYFDFSGYSDMAVGLGYLMGFTFPQNFNSPYKSLSITDFWRRWHISLSTWLRDYLYIPLGGNRKGPWRTYFNQFLTMLLGGLWHGANWTFVLWGGYHGMLLAAEKATGRRSLFWWAPPFLQRALTFILVLFGWVLFRCPTLQQAGAMFAGMFGLHGLGGFGWAAAGTPLPWIVVPAALGLAWLSPNTWEIKWKPGFPLALALSVLFVVCVAVILTNSSSPFLYFQF